MLELYDQSVHGVDYAVSVKELLLLGKYSSVCPDIRDSNFPPETWERGGANALISFRIFHSKSAMEFEEVRLELYQQNCRGASLREGLKFGIERKDIHGKISLILTRSFWRNAATAFASRQIPELCNITGTRHVYLRQLDAVYPEGTFFLSVVIGSQK